MNINEIQANICLKFGSDLCEIDPNGKIGIALASLNLSPIYGVRVKPENGTEGWYIWAGERSDEHDFFQPVHAAHIIDLLPEAAPYLALEPGYKFIIDRDGYEDVWRDEEGGVLSNNKDLN
ncbi:MAG: hypothetical protein C4K60_12105 [Ideonella sp. MAG2]|nr:MAG: hypothetical protein C4K60_12105 [Ideonella sp. MAG2]